jgi:hypothetical protein
MESNMATDTTPQDTYMLGSNTPHPVSCAGFAQCSVDECEQTDPCVAAYFAANPAYKAAACWTVEACPATVNIMQPYLGTAIAKIPKAGAKPIVQQLLGRGTISLSGEKQQPILVGKRGTDGGFNHENDGAKPATQIDEELAAEKFIHDMRAKLISRITLSPEKFQTHEILHKYAVLAKSMDILVRKDRAYGFLTDYTNGMITVDYSETVFASLGVSTAILILPPAEQYPATNAAAPSLGA